MDSLRIEPGVLARWTLNSWKIRGTGGYICEEAGDGTRFSLEVNVKHQAVAHAVGATGVEVLRSMPGDELIPGPAPEVADEEVIPVVDYPSEKLCMSISEEGDSQNPQLVKR